MKKSWGLLSENNELLSNSDKKETRMGHVFPTDGTGEVPVHHGHGPTGKNMPGDYLGDINDFKRNLKLFLRETDCKEVAP